MQFRVHTIGAGLLGETLDLLDGNVILPGR